jgi:hypothetical protein
MLFLLGAATLLSTSGCVVRERARGGGYYQEQEYDHGAYRDYPERDRRDWNRNRDWDGRWRQP